MCPHSLVLPYVSQRFTTAGLIYMNILGISAYYHDSAACLVKSGRIIAAAQEERFSRKKNDAGFPTSAISYCLQEGNIQAKDIDYIVFYEKPFLKYERLIETYLTFAPAGLQQALVSLPVWVKEKIWIKDAIRRKLPESGPILFTNHHLAHAASAFLPSPFAKAAYLTIDGVGEMATASFGTGTANRLTPLNELHFPHSLGLLYSAFTAYTGFKVNSDEYKLMGLAPYGSPRYKDQILEELIDLKEDGSFRINMQYFSYCTGMTMTSSKFHKLFGGKPLSSKAPLKQRHMDIARSIQDVTEEIFLRMARHVHRETGHKNLCLAGGVALNCVANGRLLREGPFEKIWIQPAAGDAGSALGAALWCWHHYLDHPRTTQASGDQMQGALLGPSYSDRNIKLYLDNVGARYERLEVPQKTERTATLLSAGMVIGWHQGRTEYGPRALGNRSILADPRTPEMQALVNKKIKFREDFRPFAPAILEARMADYFEIDSASPYMLLVVPIHKKRLHPLTDHQKALSGFDRLKIPRSDIPAVTHVDNSARVQTVNETDNPQFHALLQTFEQKTGCPLLLNTSFNVSEEPIVCSPEDAYLCFMATDLDALVIGSYLLEKELQPTRTHGETGHTGQADTAEQDMAKFKHSREGKYSLADTRQHRLFGLLIGSLSLLWSLPLRASDHSLNWPTFSLGITLILLGWLTPNFLSLLYRLWMACGHVIGWFITRGLLTLFYYLAISPTAYLARLLGRKFLATGTDPERSSYWELSVTPEDEISNGRKQY